MISGVKALEIVTFRARHGLLTDCEHNNEPLSHFTKLRNWLSSMYIPAI